MKKITVALAIIILLAWMTYTTLSLNSLRQTVQQAGQANAAMAEELQGLQQQVAGCRNEVTALKAEAAARQDEIAGLQTKIAEQERQLAAQTTAVGPSGSPLKIIRGVNGGTFMFGSPGLTPNESIILQMDGAEAGEAFKAVQEDIAKAVGNTEVLTKLKALREKAARATIQAVKPDSQTPPGKVGEKNSEGEF